MDINSTNMRFLFSAWNAAFQSGLSGAQSDWQRIAMRVTSQTTIEDYSWLQQLPQWREWVGPRQHNPVKGDAYTLTNKPYENSVFVDQHVIEDDRYGMYGPLFQELGYAAATFPDELVFPLVKAAFTQACYDGKPFFSVDHPVGTGTFSNLIAGAKAPWMLLCTKRPVKPFVYQERKPPALVKKDKPDDEQVYAEHIIRYGMDARAAAGFGFPHLAVGAKADLTKAALTQATGMMEGMIGAGGKPLRIMPDLLLVASNLRGAAEDLLNATIISDGGVAVSNTKYHAFDLLATPWLN